MKKLIAKVLFLAMACTFLLGAAACSTSSSKSNQGEEKTPVEIDYSLYPESFADWSIANLKDYLRKADIFQNNDWIFDMSAGDLGAVGAVAGTMYVDVTAGTITDIIMYLDTDSAALESVREKHELAPEGATEGTPMDALVGNFAFSYGLGADDAHIDALVTAVKDLAEHYNVTPDYIN
ncbi:MAG: hypothetical protein IJ773_12180 [Lachnospiraceae bacterium]|nr:hypothetical protein [Lachnospiraceae bacterium]